MKFWTNLWAENIFISVTSVVDDILTLLQLRGYFNILYMTLETLSKCFVLFFKKKDILQY